MKTMYERLDEYLSGYFTDDYWYDDGFQIAEEILIEFNKEDWDRLTDSILLKPIEWQIRFAYCADSNINNEALEILLLLCGTDNGELFETSIDSLRTYCQLDNQGIVIDNDLVDKIQKWLPRCSIPTQKVWKEFINSIKV
ncbi:hypothetical protein SH1V18_28300 [Vallitalea longa]|uniref:Uncharacterized protein n=1 Tax=Vallitalea longa TaxID=2936439 RepID=A0A9W5YD26_9FIRM|nr:hypothetical protein [Vallitalea longa]GKX30350.1 hypothetical protein SH1V18_28300 [Vallitalea longa]